MHRGNQKAHLRGEMAAQRAHPVQQLPALLLVHQRNQLEADLQGQLFQAQQRWPDRSSAPRSAFFFSAAPGSAGGAAGGLRPPPGARARNRPAGHGQKGQLGQARESGTWPPRPGWPCRAWPAWPAVAGGSRRPACPAELARVSVMPPATETSSEGMMVTSPSPTVSTV